MKSILFVLTFFVLSNLYAQDSFTNAYQFRFHFTPAFISVDDAIAKQQGLSTIGFSWLRMGVGLSFFRYAFIDGGFGLAYFKDKNSFKETVTGGYGGNIPHDAESSLRAGDLYYNLGIRFPIIHKLSSEFSIGRSNYSISRTIDRCKDCSEYKLNIEGGTFIQVGLLYDRPKKKRESSYWSYYLSYSHFLSNSSFNYFISFGLVSHIPF